MTPPNDDYAGLERPLSQHAAARVGYALAAAEISDYAAAVVPTSSDDLATPGTFITHARRARAMSLAMLEWAVLLERAMGRSWPQIAYSYGQDTQWVKDRYEPVEQEWLNWLASGAAPVTESIEMATLISSRGEIPVTEADVRRIAAMLDEWCERRRDHDAPPPPNLRLVSDGLAG